MKLEAKARLTATSTPSMSKEDFKKRVLPKIVKHAAQVAKNICAKYPDYKITDTKPRIALDDEKWTCEPLVLSTKWGGGIDNEHDEVKLRKGTRVDFGEMVMYLSTYDQFLKTKSTICLQYVEV